MRNGHVLNCTLYEDFRLSQSCQIHSNERHRASQSDHDTRPAHPSPAARATGHHPRPRYETSARPGHRRRSVLLSMAVAHQSQSPDQIRRKLLPQDIFVIPPITLASVAPSWLRRLEPDHCRIIARICLQLECDDTSTGPAPHVRDQQAQRASRYIIRCAPNLEVQSMLTLSGEETIEEIWGRFDGAESGWENRGA